MRVFSHQLTSSLEDLPKIDFPNGEVDLVFIHGSPFSLEDPKLLDNFRTHFPNAALLGCSSAGELVDGSCYLNSIVFSAIGFDSSRVESARVRISEEGDDPHAAGCELAQTLKADDLQLVILLCEGLALDCDELISGLRSKLPEGVAVSGGLAGDNLLFDRTVVLDRDGVYDNGVVAVGVYGDSLSVNLATSNFSGLECIDIEITRSEGNLIQEINGRPAVDEYRSLIGDSAHLLPHICLNFPIILLDSETGEPVCCRTLHEIIEDEQTILTAGTVPVGPAKIIDYRDKHDVFRDTQETFSTATMDDPDFVYIVNCAGRRASLGDDWKEEVEVIDDMIGTVPHLGFYSYGEIGKSKSTQTVLHNQSVNIFTLNEA